jgi:preprotein translocase subunit SecG
MGLLNVVLLSIFGVSAVLLIVLILLQDDQSEGMGGLFGGGSSNQVGNRKGNILTKTTTVLGVIFIVVAFATAWINHNGGSTSGIEKAALAKQTKANAVEWWNSTAADKTAPSASPVTIENLEASASPSPATSAAPAASASPAPAKQ